MDYIVLSFKKNNLVYILQRNSLLLLMSGSPDAESEESQNDDEASGYNLKQ